MKKLLFISIILFMISCIIGFVLSLYLKIYINKEVSKNIDSRDDNTIETSVAEEKISNNTKFIMKKCYMNCGHFKYEECELPKDFINKTEIDIKNDYPEWNIEDFSNKKIVLSKNIKGTCSDHYLIKLGLEFIEIYHVGDEEKLFKKTNISREYLTSKDIEKLESGIEVVGIAKVNSVLEDYE